MKKLRYTLLLVSLLSSLFVAGQSIQTDFDKKVIYTDSLNLPRNTSASTLLSFLPELVQRPGNQIMTNYDIQIEGVSVNSAADVALSTLQIVDIEKVEVSESPLSSYQNNGQGGSINFVLRSEGTINKNLWGSVGAKASSPLDIAPQLSIGYKNDKFMIRGIMLGEIYNSTSDSYTVTFNNDDFESLSYNSKEQKFRTGLSRIYMQYQLSSKDKLNFNISETNTYSNLFSETDYNTQDSTTQRKSSVSLSANLKYQHKTSRSQFTAEVKYNYSPEHNTNEVESLYSYDSRQKANTLSGKLEYKNVFLKKTTANGLKKQADITLGSNFNSKLSHEDVTVIDHNAVGPAHKNIPKNDTYYIMPYITMSGTFGKFRVKATGEFQHFRYNIERKDEPYSAISNDFTGKLMAEWHFTSTQNLRFILDRKLERPSADQLYPNRVFDPKQMSYVEGNPDLHPTMVHEVTLDYICNHNWNDFNNIILNFGASYSEITDIITKNRPTQETVPGSIGAMLDYISYENFGSNKIVNANAMALYTYKTFSLSFAGNMYHRMLGEEGNNNHYTYCNLSLHPHFKLKDGWNGGVRMVYFSRINQSNGYTGDSAISYMTVGKAWKRFFVYLVENVSLNKNDEDVNTSGKKRTERSYNLVQSYVGAGMKFTF